MSCWFGQAAAPRMRPCQYRRVTSRRRSGRAVQATPLDHETGEEGTADKVRCPAETMIRCDMEEFRGSSGGEHRCPREKQ